MADCFSLELFPQHSVASQSNSCEWHKTECKSPACERQCDDTLLIFLLMEGEITGLEIQLIQDGRFCKVLSEGKRMKLIL